MSRTYRRKNAEKPWWLYLETVYIYSDKEYVSPYSGISRKIMLGSVRVARDMNTKEAIREKAIYYSDSYQGGGWTSKGLTLAVQKPYRMECKRQLSNFKKDDDYPVILRSKPKKPWW
jgi:hypothetical protein